MKEPILLKKNLNEEDVQRQRKILIVITLLVGTLFIGSSYSLLTSFDTTDEVITVTTGEMNAEIAIDGSINLNSEIPKKDVDGAKNKEVKITITNTGTIDIAKYEVKLVANKKSNSTLDDKYIKTSLSEDNTNYLTSNNLQDIDNIIYTGYDLKQGETKTIYLKVWIDEASDASVFSKDYYGSIQTKLYQKNEIEPDTKNLDTNSK